MDGVELNLKDEEALAGHSWGYLAGVEFRQRDQRIHRPRDRKKHGAQAA